MKVYLLKNKKLLLPFERPASQLSLYKESVESRLRRQIKELGYDAMDIDDIQEAEDDSLIVSDRLVLSERFLSAFLELSKHTPGNTQVRINKNLFPLFCTSNPEAEWTMVGVYHKKNSASFKPIDFHPKPIFHTKEGMPSRIGEFTDFTFYVIDHFAVSLDYWFDLSVATGLLAREFIVKKVCILRKIIPKSWLYRLLNSRSLRERSNNIGKRCRIHPTAILEGCVVGDDVEIGPYCYLRSSIVGNRAVIRERSTLKIAMLGEGTTINSTDITNCYIGSDSFILSPLLNVVMGNRVFLAGGSGFADFIFGAKSISVTIDEQEYDSGLKFIGSAIGHDCFIGAGIGFAPGRTIPSRVSLMNNNLIKNIPSDADAYYVANGSDLLQIPPSFLGR